ncbi:MAG: YkgJ family cysteine cluster protein [Nanoarchaeota archaeon]|nr:YkgJ family cysteine cluster protein [Nanoarchaeota archaeon]
MTIINPPPINPNSPIQGNPIDENKTLIAKEIAQKARESLSNYCINICGAKCCKVGKLLLQTNQEVETISGVEHIGKFIEDKTLERTQNGFMTYNLEKEPCRHLKENVFCSIHKSDKKPIICNDYPLFLTKKYVIASQQCPAVVGGELNTYIKEIKKLGYKEF